MKVLAVCTGNTCRSQMLEFILRDFAHKNRLDIEAESAGLDVAVDSYTEPNAIAILRAHGIECDRKLAKGISKELFAAADAVVALAPYHAVALKNLYGDSKVICLSDFSDGPVSDPYGRGIQAYEETYMLIVQALPKLISAFLKRPDRDVL